MEIILNAKQFYILYQDDWIKAVEYLVNILKNKLYRNYKFDSFEDFILANNYLNSVDKTMSLIKIYKILCVRYKVDKEYLKTLNVGKLIDILPFLNKKNYKEWFQKIETLSSIEFYRLIEQEYLKRNIGRFTTIIRQLNITVADFNELVHQIKSLKNYWHQLPTVNKKVFLKLFKENLSVIYNVYKELKKELNG